MEFSAAIESAGPDATRCVPGHVAALECQVANRMVRLHDNDYDAVVEEAPVILERARELVDGLVASNETAPDTHVKRRLENLVAAPGSNTG